MGVKSQSTNVEAIKFRHKGSARTCATSANGLARSPPPTPVEVAPESYAETRARVAREREEFLKGYKRPEAPKKTVPPVVHLPDRKMGAINKMDKAGVDIIGATKPPAPRMAGSIRPVPPMGGGASPTGQEYRSVGDFRDFR